MTLSVRGTAPQSIEQHVTSTPVSGCLVDTLARSGRKFYFLPALPLFGRLGVGKTFHRQVLECSNIKFTRSQNG